MMIKGRIMQRWIQRQGLGGQWESTHRAGTRLDKSAENIQYCEMKHQFCGITMQEEAYVNLHVFQPALTLMK